jgi:hypothetical protein
MGKVCGIRSQPYPKRNLKADCNDGQLPVAATVRKVKSMNENAQPTLHEKKHPDAW